MFGFEQCFVFWLPSPDSNLVLDTPKKQNLISIGQFATSNDAPVRCHSDRVKGFKFKVKAFSSELKALSLKLRQIHFGHQQEISGHLGSVTGSLML